MEEKPNGKPNRKDQHLDALGLSKRGHRKTQKSAQEGCKMTARRPAYANGNVRQVRLADVEDRKQQLLQKEGQGQAAKSKNRDMICKRDNR